MKKRKKKSRCQLAGASAIGGKAESLTCIQPDRDVPGLVCGYPLPCPWHTAVITLGKPSTVTIPTTATKAQAKARRLQQIAKALEDDDA